jgi:2,5-diamino-6-(ribosylamino)-4(3H)-pyrimidinone 5'-phosphate reductase
MVEGGASIINQLLDHSQFVDALVVTIAPVFFGDGGVRVTPAKSASLANVKWWQGTRDVVLAAKMAAA